MNPQAAHDRRQSSSHTVDDRHHHQHRPLLLLRPPKVRVVLRGHIHKPAEPECHQYVEQSLQEFECALHNRQNGENANLADQAGTRLLGQFAGRTNPDRFRIEGIEVG